MNLFFSRPPRPVAATLGRRVRELELITARLIRDGFAGQYHAAFHGRGIEFAQVREYQPGDDIRTIDWNVTARSGVPHVKQFVEERDMTLLLAVDLSASMRFGSLYRRKIELATELVAVLAFSAWKNGDRVGLVGFRENVETFIPPRRGRTHVQALVRRMLSLAGGTKGSASFDTLGRFVQRVLLKPAVVIVLSDFRAPGIDVPLRRISRRHDLLALRIFDPRELHVPSGGLATVVDPESGRAMRVDLRNRAINLAAEESWNSTSALLRRSGVDAVELSTAAAYDRPLVRFFEQRTLR